MFARGFFSRGAVIRDNKDTGELAIVAVATVSSAFLGMTVGSAKCHDHVFDPISQRDFYAMMALFDPLTVKKVLLGTSADIFAQGKAQDAATKKREAIECPINDLEAPYKKKLYDERVLMLPDDVQPIFYSDLHATILKQLGIDHRHLEVEIAGRPDRLVEDGFGTIDAILA